MMTVRVDSSEAGRVAGVAMEFPATDDTASPQRIPRRLQRRLSESKTSSPSTVEDIEAKLRDADLRRQVFGRERLNGHYGAGAFVVGNTLSSTPYSLLISLIPGAIAYYLVGLHGGSEQFVYFTLVLLAYMTLVESLMMIVASTVPNFLVGLIVGAGIQGLMMLSGGFFCLPKDLPKIF